MTEKQTYDDTPKGVIYNSHTLMEISEEVRKLRLKIFTTEAPPFKSFSEVEAWIKAESLNGPSPKVQQQIEKLRWKLFKLTHIMPAGKVLPYRHEDGSPGAKLVPPDTYLENIYDKTKNLSELTGFEQSQLVMHILLGTEPVLPRVKIRKIEVNKPLAGSQKPIKRVELIITARDLSGKELTDIYHLMRRELQLERKKIPTHDDAEFYNFVSKTLPKAGEGVVAYWKSFPEKWEMNHPEDKGKVPEAYRMRYKRMLDKLNGKKQEGDK